MREYQIKAVFLYNFAQFVEWPQNSFSQASTPLIIGILGTDPFGKYLDETVNNEKVGDHPLIVRRFDTLNEIEDCHILFVNTNTSEPLKSVLSQLKSRTILTVGDSEDFIRQGGMVRFFIDQGRIRMQINLEAAKDSELEISSKLLRVADIVTPGRL